MGAVEAVIAVAGTITAIIALVLKLIKDAKAKKLKNLAESLMEISAKIETAKSDEELIAYAKERDKILNRK